MNSKEIIQKFQQTLVPIADAERAVAMRAYMKQQFDFLGLSAPLRRKASMPLIRTLKTLNAKQLIAVAEQLWTLKEREYQYVAIDLLMQHHRQLSNDDIPQLMALVQNKSWWDTVDGLASIVGDVLRIHLTPERKVQKQMDAALEHANFWVKRIALLHQLGWRENTDIERLLHYALTLAEEKEFFIRKAIGWALRDYAWHDPDCVRQFLIQHQKQLSDLSYREAGKHIL